MQPKNSAKRLNDAIAEETRRRYAAGSLNAIEISHSIMEGLTPQGRDEAAFAWIRAGVDRSIQRLLKAAAEEDARQFLLPGFTRLNRYVKVGNSYLEAGKLLLPEYRTLTKECAARIEGYQYARRSGKAEKRDKELLRELQKFDPIFARHAGGDPTMTVERAQKLDSQDLIAQKGRKAIKARWDRKKART
jgi:hypothetical protein